MFNLPPAYHMKASVSLLCISVCLLILLQQAASAECNRTVPYIPVTPYWPPGPDGSIYVESSPPGAVVSVNGENKGHAPVTISGLWPGTYTVLVEMAGFEDFTSVETITGPLRSTVYCRLVPDNSGNGLYIVSTPDNANVYLDGVLKGKTPFMMSNNAVGPHTVQVRLSGYAEWKSTVEVSKGGTQTISAILSKTDIDSIRGLTIVSDPVGAKVMLDGREKGITPATLNAVAAGIHILEIEYPGYNSWKSTVDVPESGIKSISVILNKKPAGSPGWISVSSTPYNAAVTLDGISVGRTPANSSLNLDAPEGEHVIILELSGYWSYSTRARVLPNQVSTVNAILVPLSGSSANGTLSVTSDPPGADISIDNECSGVSPLTAEDISVGSHLITMKMKGYQEYSTDIFVTAGSTGTVSATLIPAPSSLHTPGCPLTSFCALGIIGFLILRKPE
jgi:hypothetical protein